MLCSGKRSLISRVRATARFDRLLFLLLLATGLVVSDGLGAWQWPHEDARVIASFGQSVNTSFMVGMMLQSTDSTVYPVESGEIVYRSRPDHLPRLHPSPLGGVIALEHGRSFRSLYGHLDPRSVPREMEHLGLDDAVGRIGSHGFTRGETLYLEIFDLEQDVRVNPLLLLPRRPKSGGPMIQAVYLRHHNGDSGGGEERIPLQGAQVVLPEGRWGIEVIGTDLHPGSSLRVAGHSYTVRVNGEEQFRITHDIAVARDGVLRLSARRTHEQYFADDGTIRLMEFELDDEPLAVVIELRDHIGNQVQRSFRVVPQ